MAEALPLCYHGAISRKACEDLLGKKNRDGAYLIRDSETIQGAMCLCVYKDNVVYTYRLLKTHSGNYTLMVPLCTKQFSTDIRLRTNFDTDVIFSTFTVQTDFEVAEGVQETFFKSLEDLIRHYKQRNQGLAMHLRHSVHRKMAILKQTVKQAETQRPVCLREQQHVPEADLDPSDYVRVLP